MTDETMRQARVVTAARLEDGDDVIDVIEYLERHFGLSPREAEDMVDRAMEEQ